jgi:hypothetical protein
MIDSRHFDGVCHRGETKSKRRKALWAPETYYQAIFAASSKSRLKLLAEGESNERVHRLQAWREGDYYSAREQTGLAVQKL